MEAMEKLRPFSYRYLAREESAKTSRARDSKEQQGAITGQREEKREESTMDEGIEPCFLGPLVHSSLQVPPPGNRGVLELLVAVIAVVLGERHGVQHTEEDEEERASASVSAAQNPCFCREQTKQAMEERKGKEQSKGRRRTQRPFVFLEEEDKRKRREHNLESGIWNLEPGIWNQEFGAWNLESALGKGSSVFRIVRKPLDRLP
jgi:hypothetical protein